MSTPLDEALEALRSGSSPDPDRKLELARRFNERGCERVRRARQDGGSLEAALADFEAACQLDPSLGDALNNRACVLAELGDYPRAKAGFSRTLALDADHTDARDNHHLLALVSDTGHPVEQSTVSTVERHHPERFCEGLVRFLQASVSARPGFEDCRDDAVAEVVTRVLERSRRDDLPLAEALRAARRSTTRGWVRNLMRRFERRGGPELQDVPAPPPHDPATRPSLRLDQVLHRVQERLLEASGPATRWRRELVWGVYVSALLDGVQLTRREVIEATRKLGLRGRAVSDRQLQHDLDLLVRALRAGPPS